MSDYENIHLNWYFVTDLNKKGAKTKPFSLNEQTLDDCYKPKEGHMHESFKSYCIPYIDVDIVEVDGSFGDREEYRRERIDELREGILDVFGDKAVVILGDRSGHSTKHNAYKLSLRAFIRNVGYFTCPPACGKFMMENMKDLVEGIDLDAYKIRQNMGMVYNTKMGDNRILELLDDGYTRLSYEDNETELEDTIIQNIDDEDECLDGDYYYSGHGQCKKAISINVSRIDTGINNLIPYDNELEAEMVDNVLEAAQVFMPDLEIKSVKEGDNYLIIEFTKTYDECAICKRVHTGNRAYAIMYPDKAYLKCHDQDARKKKITLYNDIQDLIPNPNGDSDDDDDTADDTAVSNVPALDPNAPGVSNVDTDYVEYEDNTLELKLLRGNHQDEDYAEYFMVKFPDEFIVFDGLFHFSNHTWKSCEDDSILFTYLGKQVYNELRRVLHLTYPSIQDADKLAKISKQMLKLRSWNNRKGIVSSIKSKIMVRSDPFDLNPNLIGFKNGIYDLSKGEFRDGNASDYVSKSVSYDYREVSVEQRTTLMSFINKIMPLEDERDCLLRGLSSGLYGKTLQNMFILTGEGGNGKDTLVSKLYRDTIGREYYEYSNTSILTEKKKGDLCQGVANMHKKRVIVWSEPPKQSILQGSVLKEITGVDQVNARGLYSKNTNTLIMSTCFILCNDIPRVDSIDGGLYRRLIVIPFRGLFKMPDDIAKMENTKYVHEADGYYDTQEFRDEFKLTFFHILLDYFKQFRDHGYMMKDIPKTIKDMSAQYLADSDDFLGWFNDVYEKADGEYLQLKYVWTNFKKSDLYMNLNKSDKRVMNRQKMIEDVIKNPNLRYNYSERYRPIVNGIQKNIRQALVGYRLKVEEISSDDEEDDSE